MNRNTYETRTLLVAATRNPDATPTARPVFTVKEVAKMLGVREAIRVWMALRQLGVEVTDTIRNGMRGRAQLAISKHLVRRLQAFFGVKELHFTPDKKVKPAHRTTRRTVKAQPVAHAPVPPAAMPSAEAQL